MPIAKCIFVIFKEKVNVFAKKVVSLVSSGENVILLLLVPLQKYCWPTPGKSTIGPSLEKIFPALMFRGTCSSIEMLKGYMERESLGTPDIDNGMHWDYSRRYLSSIKYAAAQDKKCLKLIAKNTRQYTKAQTLLLLHNTIV